MGATSFLRRLLSGGQGGVDRRVHQLLSLCESLLAESGEYASTALARDALAAYQGLDEHLRGEFFDVLARHYSPAPEAVTKAAGAYQVEPSPENLLKLEAAVEPAPVRVGRISLYAE